MESYSCAASIRILLQGMLYVTNKSIYFYSPFNNKTVLGHGTKIKISYGSIKKIKKETKLLVFPNSIRFSLNSGEELLFTSFISRDTCYQLILKQCADVQYQKRMSTGVPKNISSASSLGLVTPGKTSRSRSRDKKKGKRSSSSRKNKLSKSTKNMSVGENQLLTPQESVNPLSMSYN